MTVPRIQINSEITLAKYDKTRRKGKKENRKQGKTNVSSQWKRKKNNKKQCKYFGPNLHSIIPNIVIEK